MTLRSPIVDLRAVLARHVIAGGPAANSGRLDYLVEWADAMAGVDHRTFGKVIEQSPHTPGARLTNTTSDEIHRALTGDRQKGGAADLMLYEQRVVEELEYKTAVFARAVGALTAQPVSKLRDAYRSIEADAQKVWRRRLTLHASDLVRFGRVYRRWRNSQVPAIESDRRCADQMLALVNPQAAHDMATAAGMREVAFATVVEVQPSVALKIGSRRIGVGSRVVLLHINDAACVESASVSVNTSPKGTLKIDGLSIGPLEQVQPADDANRFHFVWKPPTSPSLSVGDTVIVADFAWFSTLKGTRYLSVNKPTPDDQSAPKDDCTDSSYDDDPDAHGFCCRSHEHNEAKWSDELARRRNRGELNPQVWPPVRNADAFEVTAADAPADDAFGAPSEPAPDGLTIDDLE